MIRSLHRVVFRQDEERARVGGAEPGAQRPADDGAGGDPDAAQPAGGSADTEAPGGAGVVRLRQGAGAAHPRPPAGQRGAQAHHASHAGTVPSFGVAFFTYRGWS